MKLDDALEDERCCGKEMKLEDVEARERERDREMNEAREMDK